MERRKHHRFSATAFLNRPVTLTPIPPFIGKPVKGRLIDLSAGGLALLIGQIIPQETKLKLTLTFPDHSRLEAVTEVKHMVPRERHYLIGLEFLTIDPAWVARIDKMSADYIDCEQRINGNSMSPCIGADCAFFTMCSKPERTNLLVNLDEGLLLDFELLESSRKA